MTFGDLQPGSMLIFRGNTTLIVSVVFFFDGPMKYGTFTILHTERDGTVKLTFEKPVKGVVRGIPCTWNLSLGGTEYIIDSSGALVGINEKR